jgi:hypothetical protein
MKTCAAAAELVDPYMDGDRRRRQGQRIPWGGLIHRWPDVATVVCGSCHSPSSRRLRTSLGRAGDLWATLLMRA